MEVLRGLLIPFGTFGVIAPAEYETAHYSALTTEPQPVSEKHRTLRVSPHTRRPRGPNGESTPPRHDVRRPCAATTSCCNCR